MFRMLKDIFVQNKPGSKYFLVDWQNKHRKYCIFIYCIIQNATKRRVDDYDDSGGDDDE